MSIKIEIPLGEVVRVVDENGFLDVACVRSVDYHSCGCCVFSNREGECPFACCLEERTDKKEVNFVVVRGVKGGAEMKKLFISIGDYLQTLGGIAICKEVSPYVNHCPGCFFSPSDNCDFIACCSFERPDGKNVIFIKERGMK